VVFRMIEPWENPRSKFWWFRRRVPKQYRSFGMQAEIKFSLGTKDWDEAVLRCQEENLKLERQWRAVIGIPPTELSHLQITALAGEFYNETVATHRENPGPKAVWEKSLNSVSEVRSRRIMTSQAWLGVAYGQEARAFLKSKGINLVGEHFDNFLQAYVEAKTFASKTLLENAKRNYTPDTAVAARFPKFDPPNPARKFRSHHLSQRDIPRIIHPEQGSASPSHGSGAAPGTP
jgi:hypothetical protein